MSVEIKVPTLGESITEATVAKWLKKEGDSFDIDEPLVEIETDKITLEVTAPSAGVLQKINVKEGNDIRVGGILGLINESLNENNLFNKENNSNDSDMIEEVIQNKSTDSIIASPSAKKMVEENNLDISKIPLSRNDGRITKGDIIDYMEEDKIKIVEHNKSDNKSEQIVKMSKIRQTIAIRLKDAQNTAAILTTFNEVDMTEIINIRKEKNNSFKEQYGVKLGFMSFFIKAVITALKEFPAVNAEIKENNIIYKNYFHIGIAVGTENGLVVPVIKNADNLNFGQTEIIIVELSEKARQGKLSIDDLSDGTFTISNGGVYGSMLSAPILNPPQSGILGMHKILKRPVVVDDKIVIKQMMYLAFSYDHRIIDGKESVGFLVKIKELLENPSSLILGIS